MKTDGRPQKTRFFSPRSSKVLSSAALDYSISTDVSEANGRSICWRSVATALPGRNNKSCRKRCFCLPASDFPVVKTRSFLQVDTLPKPWSTEGCVIDADSLFCCLTTVICCRQVDRRRGYLPHSRSRGPRKALVPSCSHARQWADR